MLVKQLPRVGAKLFRWRSFLPLVFLPVGLWGLRDAEYLDVVLGDQMDDFFEAFALGVSLMGIAVRIITVGHVPRSTSGRNTKEQRAAVLNTCGVYSVVRHPLYLGNFLIILGLLLTTGLWHITIIGILAFALYYERIMMAEEKFLLDRFGEAYARWSKVTPAFFPRFAQWRKSALQFSWRMVLRREISTWLGFVSAALFLDVAEDLIADSRWELDPEWLLALAVLLLSYVVIQRSKKSGRLRVTDR
ncbi:MAG: lipid A phosphate methyltransferase [Verrucomicrobia bacterium]|nr:lipid A phosphate methyltransferase [Verrucomicrobiota bacterium]